MGWKSSSLFTRDDVHSGIPGKGPLARVECTHDTTTLCTNVMQSAVGVEWLPPEWRMWFRQCLDNGTLRSAGDAGQKGLAACYQAYPMSNLTAGTLPLYRSRFLLPSVVDPV